MTKSRLVHLEMIAMAGLQGPKSDAIRELVAEVRALKEKRHPQMWTLRECMVYGEEIGMPEGMAEAFFDHMEIVGWVWGKGSKPVRKPEAAMRQWLRSAKERAAAKPQGRPTHGVG